MQYLDELVLVGEKTRRLFETWWGAAVSLGAVTMLN